MLEHRFFNKLLDKRIMGKRIMQDPLWCNPANGGGPKARVAVLLM